MPRLRLQNTLLAGFLLLAAEPGASQSDRASEGLIGPVSSVRIEVAVFSRVGGEWVEGAREPLAAFHFDEEGYRTDESRDPRESRVETPEVRRSYDSSGRVLEELTSDFLGLVSRATYDYDLHGRLVERILYYPDGRTRKVRELHTYDSDGRKQQTTVYEAHDPGAGIGRREYVYDNEGNVVENTTYTTDGALLDRRLLHYVYDAVGNWTERKLQHCLPAEPRGQPHCTPHSVTYQDISYFRSS